VEELINKYINKWSAGSLNVVFLPTVFPKAFSEFNVSDNATSLAVALLLRRVKQRERHPVS
jgi:hypothetical protein